MVENRQICIFCIGLVKSCADNASLGASLGEKSFELGEKVLKKCGNEGNKPLKKCV